MSSAIFRTGLRAPHVVLAGAMVPAGTVLVTPALDIHRRYHRRRNCSTTRYSPEIPQKKKLFIHLTLTNNTTEEETVEPLDTHQRYHRRRIKAVFSSTLLFFVYECLICRSHFISILIFGERHKQELELWTAKSTENFSYENSQAIFCVCSNTVMCSGISRSVRSL